METRTKRDLFGALKQLLERLEREPVTFTLTRRGSTEPLEVKVGKFGLQIVLTQDLGDTNDLPFFPATIYSMAQDIEAWVRESNGLKSTSSGMQK